MKKLKQILFLVAAFIGAFGYNLIAANTVVMNYDKNLEAIDNMLGIEVDVDDNGEITDPDIELEGIGRLLRMRTFNVKEVNNRVERARVALRRRQLYRNVTSIATPTQRYIFGVKPRLDAVTQKKLANKELEFTDAFIYYTKAYQNISGNNLIIHSNDTIGVGYSNLLENGIVPSEMIMAATFLGLQRNSFDSATNSIFDASFSQAYGYAGFRSAEIEVLINGKVAVVVPVFMLNETRVFKGTDASQTFYGINLEKPLLIKPGDRINFNLKMAEGAGITNTGTIRTGVRVILAGSGTKAK